MILELPEKLHARSMYEAAKNTFNYNLKRATSILNKSENPKNNKKMLLEKIPRVIRLIQRAIVNVSERYSLYYIHLTSSERKKLDIEYNEIFDEYRSSTVKLRQLAKEIDPESEPCI